MSRRSRVLLAASACLLAGCSDKPAELDGAGARDAAAIDSRAKDPALADAATDASMLPLNGFGSITGSCGDLTGAELDSPEPSIVRNAIDFAAMPYTDDDLARLTEGGQEIYTDGNAGGSSIYSEMFAYEVLARCELADLLKTENEIIYDTPGKLSDFLTELEGRKIGVSVTRAFAFPPEEPYTVAQARALLDDKLADILESTANVSPEDAWVKQILHIMAYEPMHADSVATAFARVDAAIKSNTVVMVTVTLGMDGFMY